jgi:antitoxin PrlF
MVATITSKGQLTLPKKIREKLNVHSGDKVEFLIDENDNIFILPVKTSVKELKGMVPPPGKVVSLKDMEGAIILEGSRI